MRRKTTTLCPFLFVLFRILPWFGFFYGIRKGLNVYLHPNAGFILFSPVFPRPNQLYHTLSVITSGNLQKLTRSNLQEYDSKELDWPKTSLDIGSEGICWPPNRQVKSEEMVLKCPWDRRWCVSHTWEFSTREHIHKANGST